MLALCIWSFNSISTMPHTSMTENHQGKNSFARKLHVSQPDNRTEHATTQQAWFLGSVPVCIYNRQYCIAVLWFWLLSHSTTYSKQTYRKTSCSATSWAVNKRGNISNPRTPLREAFSQIIYCFETSLGRSFWSILRCAIGPTWANTWISFPTLLSH